MRRAVFHFHLFKNAGSSVDRILRDSFPGGWAEREFRFTKKNWPYSKIKDWIEETPTIKAYSSHTARLPLPEVDGVELFPVFFLRHPLIRLHSGFKYELAQEADTPGARKAKETDFKGYLEWRLTRPNDASARNFQSNRLSHLYRAERGKLTEKKDLEDLALRALDTLPFIGFVEQFDASMKTLARALSRKDLELKLSDAKENVNSDLSVTTEARVNAIRKDIGEALFERYCDHNSVDLKVYDIVKGWYG